MATLTPYGNAAARIIEQAGSVAGTLVVMATQGRTGLAGALLGSVARRVVQHGDTPVLTVRPPVPT